MNESEIHFEIQPSKAFFNENCKQTQFVSNIVQKYHGSSYNTDELTGLQKCYAKKKYLHGSINI